MAYSVGRYLCVNGFAESLWKLHGVRLRACLLGWFSCLIRKYLFSRRDRHHHRSPWATWGLMSPSARHSPWTVPAGAEAPLPHLIPQKVTLTSGFPCHQGCGHLSSSQQRWRHPKDCVLDSCAPCAAHTWLSAPCKQDPTRCANNNGQRSSSTYHEPGKSTHSRQPSPQPHVQGPRLFSFCRQSNQAQNP